MTLGDPKFGRTFDALVEEIERLRRELAEALKTIDELKERTHHKPWAVMPEPEDL